LSTFQWPDFPCVRASVIPVIQPVVVTNTGSKKLVFEYELTKPTSIELDPGQSKDLSYGNYRVVVVEYEPVVIARIQYPDDKKFSVEAEKAVEGAQFKSDVFSSTFQWPDFPCVSTTGD